MKLNKLTLRSMLALGALPVAVSAQTTNFADFPVPAYVDESDTLVLPVFVDPNVTPDQDGASWDTPLSLTQITGGALTLPAAHQTLANSRDSDLTNVAVQIVVKEWVDASGDHMPISSAQFDALLGDFVATTFTATIDGTSDTLPVVGVRWGYEADLEAMANTRNPHSVDSVIGVVAPNVTDPTAIAMDGSYQTVIPGSGDVGETSGGLVQDPAVITATASGVLTSETDLAHNFGDNDYLMLDGVNLQSGRQLTSGDTTTDRGAGLRILENSITGIFITNSQFTDNFAVDVGGAVAIPENAPRVIVANVGFVGNQAEAVGGGAIFNSAEEVAVYQSEFDTNLTAQGQGGAYYGDAGSNVDFVSNVFYGNNADQQGGAGYLSLQSKSAFINNHFVDNTSELNGGALFFTETAELDLTDSYYGILSTDEPDIDSDEELYDFYNNLFIANQGAGFSTLAGQIRFVAGNPIDLTSTPAFAGQANRDYDATDTVDINGAVSDARGSDAILGTADDQVIPTVDGVLYNGGSAAAVPDIGYLISAKSLDEDYLDFFPVGWTDPTGDALDVKNDPRIFDTNPEIGAYEIQGEIPDVPPPPKIIYVDDNAPGDENGVHDGNTWESAYLFVQDALMRAELDPSVNEIWIAEAENMEKSHILTREALPARSEFVDAPELYWDGRDVNVGEDTVGTALGLQRTDGADDPTDLPRKDEVPAWKVPANYCVLTNEFLDEQVRRTAYNPGRRTGLFVTVGEVEYPASGDTILDHYAAVEADGEYAWLSGGTNLFDGTANIQIPVEIDARPVRGEVLGTLESPKTFNGEPYPVPSYFTKDRYEELARPAVQSGIYWWVQDVPVTYLRRDSGDDVRTIIYSKKDVPFLTNNEHTIPYFSALTPVPTPFLAEFYTGAYDFSSGLGTYTSPAYQRDTEYDPTPATDQIFDYKPRFTSFSTLEVGIHPDYAFQVRRDLDDRRVVIYGGFDGWRVDTADFDDAGGMEVPNLYDPQGDDDRSTGEVIEQYETAFAFTFGDAGDSWTVSDFDRERFLAQRSDSNDTILSGDLDVSKYIFTRWDNPNLNVFNSWVDNRHSAVVIEVESDREMLSNADRGSLMLQSHLQVEFLSDGSSDITTVDDIGPGSDNPDPDWSFDADSTFSFTYDDDSEILLQSRDKHNFILEQLSIEEARGVALELQDNFSYLAKLNLRHNRSTDSGSALHAYTSFGNETGVKLVDSNVYHNSTTGSGVVYLNNYADVSIMNSNFLHNRGDDGGAIYLIGDTAATVHNSVFVANTAATRGGAIYMNNHVNLAVYSSLFTGNNATNGGAIYSWDSIYDVVNSVFAENTAGSASAISINDSAPYFLNTIFYRNMSQGTMIDDPFFDPFNGGGSPIFHDSIITGTQAYALPNGANIIRQDPMFDDVDVFKGASGLYFYPAAAMESDGCSLVIERKFDDLTAMEINALKGEDGLFGTSDDSLGFMLSEGSPGIGTGFDGQDIGIYKDQGDAVARTPSVVEDVFEQAVYLGGGWVRVPELNNDHMWVDWEPYVYSINHGWVYPIEGAEGIYLWIYNGSWNLFLIDLDDFTFPLADDLLDDSDQLVPLPFTGM